MIVEKYKTKMDRDRNPYLVKTGNQYVCDGNTAFTSPDIIYNFCHDQLELEDETEEYVYAFALDNAGRLRGIFEVSHGTYSCSIVSNREIFQKLLLMNATSFVLVHNHPTGFSKPSEDDINVTKNVMKAGKLLGVELKDHIIIGFGNYYSFLENNYLFFEPTKKGEQK